MADSEAETWTFVPLFEPTKIWKKPQKLEFGRRLEAKRKRLGKGEWHAGELERVDENAEPIPGAWCTDLRRYRARMIGDALGLRSVYWASRGDAIEEHQVEPFSDEDTFELDQIRHLSQGGLRQIAQAAARFGEIDRAAEAAESDTSRLTRIAVVTVGLACLFAACSLIGWAFLPQFRELSGLRRAVGLLAHPALLPTLLIGVYLRGPFAGGGTRRELSHPEATHAWHESSPHLLAVWAILCASVLALTVGQLAWRNNLDPIALADFSTTYAIGALWILTPLSYARDRASAIGAFIEGAITVFVAVFVTEIAMLAINLATGILWGIVGGIVPFEIPEWIRALTDVLTNLAGEFAFFSLVVGYTWSKAQQHHGRWATKRTEGQPAAA